MKIAIDLDGTIWKTYQKFLLAFYRQFGYSCDPKRLSSLSYFSGEEKEWFVKYFQSVFAYTQLSIYRNCIGVINKWIQKGFQIYFLTSRPTDFYALTIKELRKIGLPVDNLYLIARGQKGQWSEENQIDIVIEDETPNALDILSYNILVILLIRDWNKNDLKEVQQAGGLIAHNWLEIQDIIGGEK